MNLMLVIKVKLLNLLWHSLNLPYNYLSNRGIGIVSLERGFLSSIADTMNWFSKFNFGSKSILHQGLSELDLYGYLVYKFKKIMGRTDLSDHL